LVATGFDAITTPGGSGASTLAGSVSATFGELGHSLSGQAASVLSSFVIGAIADALHLPGTARGLFTVAGATAANQLVSNLANGLDAFAGFDTAAMGLQLGNAFGSFFGSHLAPVRRVRRSVPRKSRQPRVDAFRRRLRGSGQRRRAA
jgi:hypothetical protein